MVLEFGNPNLEGRCFAGSVWLGARVERHDVTSLLITPARRLRMGIGIRLQPVSLAVTPSHPNIE
jgi:hypothetical protein